LVKVKPFVTTTFEVTRAYLEGMTRFRFAAE
jgi:hypothetical protein